MCQACARLSRTVSGQWPLLQGDDSTKTCRVIDGLTTEASDTIKDVTGSSVRDIALIGAAQQFEHHEIAVDGTLRRWAEIIGLSSGASILKSIEAEEVKADELLAQIAGAVICSQPHNPGRPEHGLSALLPPTHLPLFTDGSRPKTGSS